MQVAALRVRVVLLLVVVLFQLILFASSPVGFYPFFRKREDGRSAIAEMCRQILKLEAMTDRRSGITVNVGLISGGTGVNVVPAHCSARVETRVPTMAATEAMRAAIEGLTPHDPDVRIAVRGGLNPSPYEKTPAIAALFAHAQRLAAEIGFGLQDTSSGGGSDGNFTAAMIPTLDGLGVDGEGAHTDHEQLYVSSLEPRAELLYRLIATLD